MKIPPVKLTHCTNCKKDTIRYNGTTKYSFYAVGNPFTMITAHSYNFSCTSCCEPHSILLPFDAVTNYNKIPGDCNGK